MALPLCPIYSTRLCCEFCSNLRNSLSDKIVLKPKGASVGLGKNPQSGERRIAPSRTEDKKAAFAVECKAVMKPSKQHKIARVAEKLPENFVSPGTQIGIRKLYLLTTLSEE